ncbi:HesA/MoeB/ThiF family protein [Pontibacillus salipaludis]|uniref:Heme biosynthesis protein HemY n=1 Tax=Pontibacillus salipaludis TaxID=1697394 RepID=A0ABQ1Q1C7_9BACI|nr:ThiF family adenylyltransferase [Pontibacillus salipaludis]GGD10285.1 heme biosynthesis protein HemY [Pontibacillus salipaludis]
MAYIRTKPNLIPFIYDENNIRVGGYQHGIARNITTNETELVFNILQELNGDYPREEQLARISSKYELDHEETEGLLHVLTQHGVLEEQDPYAGDMFTEREADLYSRNVNLFSWIDKSPRLNPWELQYKLKTSSAVVLGSGGVGVNIAASLAGLGVGKIRIVDYDKVEESNLNRQMYYSMDDVGKLKVEALQEQLLKKNPHIDIEAVQMKLNNEEDIEKVCKGVDLIILAADEPRYSIEKMVNRVSYRIKTPWIMGAYASTAVNCMAFIPGETPCFNCIDLRQNNEIQGHSQIEVSESIFGFTHAVTAPVAALAGHLASLEAMYHLIGLKPRTTDFVYQINLYTFDTEHIKREHYDGCDVCQTSKEMEEEMWTT